MPLNGLQIKRIKPTDKKQTLSDGGGLAVVVNAVSRGGTKYFVYNYRFDGKQQSLRIGKYPDICVMLIMLCFARNTEIRGGKWQEIDFGKKTWVIPAERMKRPRPHVIPLADWPLELLKELHTITGHSPFLSPSRPAIDGHISENTAGKIINNIGYKGIATPHGFRSLASSILNEQGCNPDAIERQLAHIDENRIRAAYNRADYIAERREMMQWYSDYLRERYNAARAMIERETGSRE